MSWLLKLVWSILGTLFASPKENAAVIQEAEAKEAASESAAQAQTNVTLLEKHDATENVVDGLADADLVDRVLNPPKD